MLRNRRWLFFPFQAGTGRIPPEGSYAFKEATFVQSLAQVGYETICIGGVNFFSKRNDIGRVFPGYFRRVIGCRLSVARIRTVLPIRWTLPSTNWKKYPADRKVFMYINFSAIHYPNCHYVEGKKKDDKESHAAALRYVDSQLPRLFEAFRRRSDTLVIACLITGPVTVKMVTSIIASLTKKYIRCLINTLFSENERTTADFTICQLYVQLSA